jgi:hypothetical protein
MGQGEFIPQRVTSELSKSCGQDDKTLLYCFDLVSFLFFGPSTLMTPDDFTRLSASWPSSVAVRNLQHWAQWYHSGNGPQRYDFGLDCHSGKKFQESCNLNQYGQDSPPRYDVGKYRAKTAVLEGVLGPAGAEGPLRLQGTINVAGRLAAVAAKGSQRPGLLASPCTLCRASNRLTLGALRRLNPLLPRRGGRHGDARGRVQAHVQLGGAADEPRDVPQSGGTRRACSKWGLPYRLWRGERGPHAWRVRPPMLQGAPHACTGPTPCLNRADTPSTCPPARWHAFSPALAQQ